MTTQEKMLERVHILSTIAAYPDRSAGEVRDIANDECQYEVFDPLPFLSPQGIAAKLRSLSADGLIDHWTDGEPRWRITDDGQAFLDAEVAALEGSQTSQETP